MKIRLARDIQPDSIVDGAGLRTVIWTQGCSHNCKGCHNPDTHDFNGGFSKDIEELKKEISLLELQDGVTLSGGDPFFQVDACLEIASFCQSIDLNVWCYTGFTIEQLFEIGKVNKNVLRLLDNIDVLVDGKFQIELKSYDCKFRGSKNQRLIDVRETLKTGKVVTLDQEVKEDYGFSIPRKLYV